MEAEAKLDKISKELDADLEEMSKHQVYQKYAYMSLREITDVMFENPSSSEFEYWNANSFRLDSNDINMLTGECASPTHQTINQMGMQNFTSMVILRAP